VTYDLTNYEVTYNANGATGGNVPEDGVLYFIGDPVTALGSGTLARTNYSFLGWNTSSTATTAMASTPMVTGGVTWYAVWALNTYTVTWLDGDGTALETDLNVPYGAIPAFNSANPTKAATAEFTYTFNGWSPAVSAVTADVIYMPTFSEANNLLVTPPAVETGLIYNGTVQTGVNAGPGYSLTGNTGTEAGNYTATATLTDTTILWSDDNTTAPKTIPWSIGKAAYDMSGANWEYTVPFTYDGIEKSMQVTGLPVGVTAASYSGNTATDAGAYTASVTLTYDLTNYGQPVIADLPWSIGKAAYNMNGASWNYSTPFTYDATEKTVEVTGLPTDVTIASYTGNTATNVGAYTASVTLTYDLANYEQPFIVDLSWSIGKAAYDMSGASWDYKSPFTYGGTEKTLQITGLPAGVTVASYAGNTATNAGNYTASVTLTYDAANYEQPLIADLSWAIGKAAYDMSGASWDYTIPFTYDGTGKTVLVTGLPAGVTAASYTGHAATDAGAYTASVTFTYDATNYEQPVIADLPWSIGKVVYTMSGTSWDYTTPFTFDGTVKGVQVTGLPAGVTVASYTGNIATNAGTYTALVTLAYDAINYEPPVIANLPWAIGKAVYNMSGERWDYTTPFAYDGTKKAVLVTGLPSGVTATSYTGNTATNAGAYSASVTLAYDALNYEQPSIADLSWAINKAVYNMSGAGWDYTVPFTYDGTEKTVQVTGLPAGVTAASYTGNTATNAGTYTASVTLAYDALNYEQPVIADLSWAINKAAYNMSNAGWDYTVPFTYDGTEKTVQVTGLPAGVTAASYTGNTATNVGPYTASVALTYDAANYEQPVIADLSWAINKAVYNMSGASWDYTSPFTYDGTEKTVQVTGLPVGVTVVSYTGSAATDVGNYTATVTLAYDAANYEQPVIADLPWSIGKAAYNMSGAGWDYTAAFTYSGTEKTVLVTGLPTGVTVASYTGNTATNIGNYIASVTLAYDAANYEQPVINDLSWAIGKAAYDMSNAGWDYTAAFTYDGTEKTVQVTGLPTGVTVASYTGNTAANVGNYTATVTLGYDAQQYQEPIIPSLAWKIVNPSVTTLRPAPKITKIEAIGGTSLKLTWTKVTGAAGYEIYRSTSKTGTYTLVKTTTAVSFSNTFLKAGIQYFYKIRTYDTVAGVSFVSSNYSAIGAGVPLAKPTITSAKGISTSQIKLAWSKVISATGYQILRSSSATGIYTTIKKTTALSLIATGLRAGTTYYFKVIPYKTIGTTNYFGPVSRYKAGTTL
jgi:hypothetical protein